MIRRSSAGRAAVMIRVCLTQVRPKDANERIEVKSVRVACQIENKK
jgi:hypothetical protein